MQFIRYTDPQGNIRAVNPAFVVRIDPIVTAGGDPVKDGDPARSVIMIIDVATVDFGTADRTITVKCGLSEAQESVEDLLGFSGF